MNDTTLQRIKVECEKIEQGSGHGQVVITIQDRTVHLIKPQEYILATRLDKVEKVCIK